MASRRRIGPLDRLGQLIHTIRGQRVMLDADIARLYGVPTKALLQAVKRNAERFPADFMLRLTEREAAALRSQTVTANMPRGGRRTLPFAFTEQGVAMLSSVLRSVRALQVNIEIMRVFVRLRSAATTQTLVLRRLDALDAASASTTSRSPAYSRPSAAWSARRRRASASASEARPDAGPRRYAGGGRRPIVSR